MIEIVNNLYVSSLESANNSELLHTFGIKYIISLGCEVEESISSSISNIAFPDVLDTPDNYIINVCEACFHIIDLNLREEIRTLVHCVYGQSRSATIVASFLLFASDDFKPKDCNDIRDVIALMNYKHPNLCINPGFLCQLFLLSESRSFSSSLVKLLEFGKPKISYINRIMGSNHDMHEDILTRILRRSDFETSSHESDSTHLILCKRCKSVFAKDPIDIATTNMINYDMFLKEHLHEYWRDFKSVCRIRYPSTRPSVSLTPNAVLIAKSLPFSDLSGSLICYDCKEKCGEWIVQGRPWCGDFVPSYSFDVYKDCVIKRRIFAC